MKRIITAFATILITGVILAQSPEKMSYQAVVRNSSDVLVTNTPVGMQISILQGSETGTVVYIETQTPTTNTNGLVTIEIGEGTTSDDFSDINWATSTYFIKTETDPTGGTNYSITGTSQLLSVPYALHAKTAENITETDPIYGTSQAANITGTDITNLNNLSGTNTGDQDINGISTNMQAIQDTAALIRSDIDPAVWNTNGSSTYYNDGYVGIGTTTPGTGLGLRSAAGYGSAIGLQNTGGGLEWRLTSWTDGTFRLVKSTGTTFSAIVAEPLEGKIGIGTSSPDQKLSVHSASGTSYVRVSDNTTGPASGLRMGMSGSGDAYIINDEAVKSLSLGTSGTSQLRINDLGHVGINDLTPDVMLHVKQDVANRGIRIEHQTTADYWDNGIGTTTRNYKFYYNGLFRADISSVDGAYVQSSDKRLKKDIQYMGSVLDKVMKLKPATYYYIDNDKSAARSKGFVTQDVEDIFPNLVREIGDGYSGIVYDGFAVISIKAIQEMNVGMKEMQTKTDQMQAEIEELKRAIETLK